MHLYTWIILIALLFGLGIVLKRAWLGQTAEAETLEPAPDASHSKPSGLAQLTNSVLGRVEALRNGLAGKGQEETVVSQFREWAPHAFAGYPQIEQWLAALSDEQIAALTDHLQVFCRDMGFELGWLLEKQVSPSAGLMKGLTDIILYYTRASYQAVQLQGEVELFRVYHDFMQNPTSRANRELGEHLFGKLMEQGKSPIKISEHLAASTRKRQQQMIDTIQQVANNDPQALNATLKLVLVERAMAQIPNGNGNGNEQHTNGSVDAQTVSAGTV